TADHTVSLRIDGTDVVVSVDGVAQSRPRTSVQSLTVVGSDGDDTLDLGALTAQLDVPVVFDGGAGFDTIRGPPAGTTWTIDGPGSGAVGTLSYAGVESLRGAPDNEDTFVFGPGGSLAGTVDGGSGGYDTVEIAGNGAPIRSTITGPQSGV